MLDSSGHSRSRSIKLIPSAIGIDFDAADRRFAHCGTNLVGRLSLQFLKDLLRLLLGRERSTHLGYRGHRVRRLLKIRFQGYKQSKRLVVAL